MKQILLIFFVIISFNLSSEIATVPDFNYSLDIPEGWELLSFDSLENLRWISHDGKVALIVKTRDGSSYDSITDMANELITDFTSDDILQPYNYLGVDAALSEVNMDIKGLKHKGWLFILNGYDYDYYIIAYSLLNDYEEYKSDIKSVVDSFVYGKENELNVGPISSFDLDSPNRVYKKFSIDFFNQTLEVMASEYDFSASQYVIEREAEIMNEYAYKPDLFYKAWQRYYKIIFRDSFNKLDSVYNALKPYIDDDKYSDYQKAELIMFWIQGFEYRRDQTTRSDLLNPLEAALTKTGDCDARSLLMGILLKKFGINSLLLTSEKLKHAIIAVDCEGDGLKYNYKGKDYLMVELTAKALMGEVDERFKDPSLWTPVEMEYLSGL